jgi:hypothetical protein
MREMVGLVVGLYLTAALVVFGGAAYGFISGENAEQSRCEPNYKWAAYRAAIWPKTYFDDAEKARDFVAWLLVRYEPFPEGCPAP